MVASLELTDIVRATASPPQRRRVLVVTDYSYPSGGVEHSIVEILKVLAKHHDCEMLSWSMGVLRPSDVRDVTVIDNGDIRSAWSKMDCADIIVMPVSFNVRLLSRLVTEYVRRVPKPLVTIVSTSSHSDPSAGSAGVQAQWFKEMLRCSSTVVAVSDDVRKVVNDASAGEARVTVIENAARLRASVRRERDQRETVAFIGRPFAQKGFPDFLRLSAELAGMGLRFTANTVSVILDQQHFPRIELSALLDDDRLLEFFDAADVLVAPYRAADGLPLALQEALNCGVPVIGYDSPGVGQLLRRHRQHVIPPRFPDLVDAVSRWRSGRLAVVGPEPGSVVSWRDVGETYVRLIGELAGGLR